VKEDVQSYKTDIYKKSVMKLGNKLYNKMPGYIKEMDNCRAFKNKLKSLILYNAFYSMEKFFSL